MALARFCLINVLTSGNDNVLLLSQYIGDFQPEAQIKGFSGRSFMWNEDSTKFDDKTKFGFIAQEVETILPELVDSNGIMHFDANDNICDEFEATSHSKSVFETGVIPITVEALKILIAKVETLEAEVAALKAK